MKTKIIHASDTLPKAIRLLSIGNGAGLDGEHTFKEIPIGTRFDFISGTSFDSFFLACMKTGPRSYVDAVGAKHKVGSVAAKVYNVGRNF